MCTFCPSIFIHFIIAVYVTARVWHTISTVFFLIIFSLEMSAEKLSFFLYFFHFQSVSLWVMKYTCIRYYYYKWWDSYSLHHQHGEHTQLSMVTSRQCSADDLVMSNKGLSINLFPLWIISFLHFIIFTNFVHFVVAFFCYDDLCFPCLLLDIGNYEEIITFVGIKLLWFMGITWKFGAMT